MVHIAPWEAAWVCSMARRGCSITGGSLILYGPWLEAEVETAPSNVAFDQSLKARDPRWGLRLVEEFAAEASSRGLFLADRRAMPANNIMLRFEVGDDR